MKFELVIPGKDSNPGVDLTHKFIDDIGFTPEKRNFSLHDTRMLVMYGSCIPTREIDIRKVAGKVVSCPTKGPDGKWYLDVEMLDSPAGKEVLNILPTLRAAGCAMKVFVVGYNMGHLEVKWQLWQLCLAPDEHYLNSNKASLEP